MTNQSRHGKKLMALLAQGVDPEEAVKKLGITLNEAAGAARRPHSRQTRKSHLALARLQRELVAAKESHVALRCLRKVMTNTRVPPAVRLKAALALLQEAHGKQKPTRKSKDKTPPNVPEQVEPVKPEEVDGMIEMLQGLRAQTQEKVEKTVAKVD